MSRDTSKDLRSLFIYQVFVRNHTQEGTFKALEKDLSRIKRLGVDIIYLLPIHPIGEVKRKGRLGSPYSIKDYYTINDQLGTLEDFKSLVEETHNQGMKLMMDIVFNHTSYDSVLIKEHPEYFYKKDGEFTNRVGDWWDITDLDYSKDKDLWTYLIDVLKYWASLGVDGFRFDVASLLPLDFLQQMKVSLKEAYPNIILLSESVHGGFCRYLRNQAIACLSESEIYQVFDMAYDYDTHPYFEAYLNHHGSFQRYCEELLRQEEIYPENYVKLRNLENHDYGRFAKMVDGNIKKIKQWLALTFFSKGATMIYAGQEFCDKHLPSLFEKDVVDWQGHDLSSYIKALNILTKNNLTAYGAYEILPQSKDVYLGYYLLNEDQLIGIFNVGLQRGKIQVPLEDGTYYNQINNEKIKVKNKQIDLIDSPIIIKN